MTYAERERARRFVIYVDGKPRSETTDRDQMEHVVRLYIADGHKVAAIKVRNLSANQES